MSYTKEQNVQRSFVEGYRDLWSAVVLQAKEDILTAPLNSIEYDQAVAFFTGGGEWSKVRVSVGDFLELHHDDLVRCGRRCIDDRLKIEAARQSGQPDQSIIRSPRRGRPPGPSRAALAPVRAPAFSVAETYAA